jgi:hypothetical protein
MTLKSHHKSKNLNLSTSLEEGAFPMKIFILTSCFLFLGFYAFSSNGALLENIGFS